MIDRPARADIGEPLLNRLTDVHFIGEIVPARIGGQQLDKPNSLGSNIGRIAHTS